MSIYGTESDGRWPVRLILTIFVMSLFTRFLVYWWMADQAVQPVSDLIIDSIHYWKAAIAIRGSFDFDTHDLNIFGPGYPSFIAILGYITNKPSFVTFVQVFTSAFASAGLAFLGWRLTGEKKIALFCGLVHALSWNSISLANLIMSDSIFFTLIVFGLILYFEALHTNSWKFYLPAALILGMAPLFRSIGLFFAGPLVIIAISHLWPLLGEKWKEKRRFLIGPAVVIGFVFLFVGGWVTRDRPPHLPPFAYSNDMGMFKVVALTRAELFDIEYSDAMGQIAKEIKENEPWDHKLNYVQETFLDLVLTHPFTVVGCIISSGSEKANNSKTHLWRCLPDWARSINKFEDFQNSYFISYRVSLLVIIGIVLIWRERRFRLLIALLSIYLYFIVMSGFTVNTWGRIFYPGMIAWSILAAYPVVALYNVIKARFGRLRIGKVQVIKN